jgi:hypothetical protein
MSTRLYVYDNNKRAVPAKYLEINGKIIRDPSGNPYKVPADFDWNTYVGKFETFKHSLEARDNTEPSFPDAVARDARDTAEVYRFLIGQFRAAWPASPSDIQRTYNGYSGKGEGDFGKKSCRGSFIFLTKAFLWVPYIRGCPAKRAFDKSGMTSASEGEGGGSGGLCCRRGRLSPINCLLAIPPCGPALPCMSIRRLCFSSPSTVSLAGSPPGARGA